MKTMAFSVVILLSAGAMAGGSACSSTTTTTNNGTTDGSTDVTSGSSSGATGDDGSGSSSGIATGDDGSGSSSGGTTDSGSTDSGGSCPWAQPQDAGTPLVPNPYDGGEDTSCEQCITGSCDAEWQCCFNDSSISMVETPDGGTTPAPSCYAYVACVQGDILSSDAGVQTALADCAGPDGGSFPANSITVGGGLLSCVVSKCAQQCGL
jgi:hypothetical protein